MAAGPVGEKPPVIKMMIQMEVGHNYLTTFTRGHPKRRDIINDNEPWPHIAVKWRDKIEGTKRSFFRKKLYNSCYGAWYLDMKWKYNHASLLLTKEISFFKNETTFAVRESPLLVRYRWMDGYITHAAYKRWPLIGFELLSHRIGLQTQSATQVVGRGCISKELQVIVR